MLKYLTLSFCHVWEAVVHLNGRHAKLVLKISVCFFYGFSNSMHLVMESDYPSGSSPGEDCCISITLLEVIMRSNLNHGNCHCHFIIKYFSQVQTVNCKRSLSFNLLECTGKWQRKRKKVKNISNSENYTVNRPPYN